MLINILYTIHYNLCPKIFTCHGVSTVYPEKILTANLKYANDIAQ